MCTVTYIPLSDGFALSSNRDETPLRANNPLTTETIGKHEVIYPKDTKGGSWLFASNKGEVVCVLNGAFNKHKHQPPYRMSRGLIARNYFNYDHPRAFLREVDLKGIEPFTMVIGSTSWLYVLRWNEREKHIDILDPCSNHIWSSSTLYDPEMVSKRKTWFESYVKDHPTLDMKDVRYIQRNGSVGDPTQDYIMNRMDLVKTVSISHVHVSSDKVDFHFENLVHNKLDTASLMVNHLFTIQ